MNDCKVCQSSYKADINRMISNNANEKYIQSWCKERGLKLTLKSIREHIKEGKNLKSKAKKTDFSKIIVSEQELISKLNLKDSEVQAYKNSKGKASSQRLNIVEFMQFQLSNLTYEENQLREEFNQITGKSNTERLNELKTKNSSNKFDIRQRLLTLKRWS